MLQTQIKTPSDLKAFLEDKGSHFFDRKTLSFFGDTMRNYGLCTAKILVAYDADDNRLKEPLETEVWELYRKRAVKHGVRSSAYFRKDNLEQTWPAS